MISPRTNSPITYDDVSNMDGKTLRDQIYTDWLQRKRSFTKEESKIRKEKQNKVAEESERKAHERRVDVRNILYVQSKIHTIIDYSKLFIFALNYVNTGY